MFENLFQPYLSLSLYLSLSYPLFRWLAAGQADTCSIPPSRNNLFLFLPPPCFGIVMTNEAFQQSISRNAHSSTRFHRILASARDSITRAQPVFHAGTERGKRRRMERGGEGIKERKGGDQFPIGTNGLLTTVECHLCTSGRERDINIRRDKRHPERRAVFVFIFVFAVSEK